MITPASTIPMICGMRSLLITIGATRIIISTTKKINVGSVIGKYDVNNVILRAKVRYFLNTETQRYREF